MTTTWQQLGSREYTLTVKEPVSITNVSIVFKKNNQTISGTSVEILPTDTIEAVITFNINAQVATAVKGEMTVDGNVVDSKTVNIEAGTNKSITITLSNSNWKVGDHTVKAILYKES